MTWHGLDLIGVFLGLMAVMVYRHLRRPPRR
jgi:hypothetical protein